MSETEGESTLKIIITWALLALVCSVCPTKAASRLPECRLGVEIPQHVRLGSGVIMVIFDGPRCYGVYENGRISERIGKPIYGYAVTGGAGTPTPLTDFLAGPQRIVAKKIDAVSSEFPVHADGTRGGAKMPYAQFIDVGRGIAIHQGNIDDPAGSKGCIRVGPESARVLFEEFSQEEIQVIVTADRGSLRVLWEGGYFRAQRVTPMSANGRNAHIWHEEPE